MIWKICLITGTLLYIKLLDITAQRLLRRRKTGLCSMWALIGIAFLASFVVLLPIVVNRMEEGGARLVQTILIAAHKSVQLFGLEGDFFEYQENVAAMLEGTGMLRILYTVLISVSMVVAPLVTCGLASLLFVNISEYLRMSLGLFGPVYVFSELNERSVILAESCLGPDKTPVTRRPLLIFAGITDSEEEEYSKLTARLEEMSAIRMKQAVTDISFRFWERGPLGIRRKKKPLFFFILNDNEQDNINESLALAERFAEEEKVSMYSFLHTSAGQLMVSARAARRVHESAGKITSVGMKIRCVDETDSLVTNFLYQNDILPRAGTLRGESAESRQNGLETAGERPLRYVVVGMGHFGAAMTKALLWSCQLPGYQLEIHIVDQDPETERIFAAQCPEIMKYNGIFREGDSNYRLTFHCGGDDGAGTDVRTGELEEILLGLSDIAGIFVSLGEDVMNMETAIRLRRLMSRRHSETRIWAVVRSGEMAEILREDLLRDVSGRSFDIGIIGEYQESYSLQNILSSELEERALAKHMTWSGDDPIRGELTFFHVEYNYRSSIAGEIRRQYRIRAGVPGADKEPADRTPEEREQIRRYEHAGWDAYLRTAGYVYDPGDRMGSKDHLAKVHSLLIPFDELSESEKRKDD